MAGHRKEFGVLFYLVTIMIFYVYVLQSLTCGIFYTGYTSDLQKRIERHNNSMNIYTKNREPWKLIYYEVYLSRSEAMKREKFLKTGKGREQIRHLLERMNRTV